MSDLIHQLLAWVSANPHWAGLAIFVVACAESLAVVGLVVPGAVMMFGAGALIAAGAMGFWSTLTLAVAGAVLGDSLSYWLGYRYNDKVRQWWPFNRHPELLLRGEQFFKQHGGKSIFVARFVGPVRAVVPMVAGMLAMSPRRFFLANILSALAWAPAYLLLGMAFGASLALAGAVAGRLAVLLGVILVAAWIIIKVVHVVYKLLHTRGLPWAENHLSQWSRHRKLAWIVGDLFNPEKPLSRTLLLWLCLLLGGTWLFLGVLEDVVSGDPLVSAGQSVFGLLQELRTPIGDRIMVAFSELGDAVVGLTVVIAVLLWMLWKRAWREALYWLAAAGFAVLAVVVFKYALHIPRPVELYAGVASYSFPSGHAAVSTVLYGYLAMLSAQTLSLRWRWLPYAIVTLLVMGISFSRLYLGAHWLADVVGGIGLGVAWIALLAIARHFHLPAASSINGGIKGLPYIALLAVFLMGSWHINARMTDDLQRYAIQHSVKPLFAQTWWQTGWQEIPGFRVDLEGEQEQPLNIQWAGELTQLRQTLKAKGWNAPPPVTLTNALSWLSPNPSLAQLPVLPQLHSGQQEVLLLTYVNPDQTKSPGQQLVLRLWPSDVRLEPGGGRLWVGTVSGLRMQCLPLICFPRLMKDFDVALTEFESMRPAVERKSVERASVNEDEHRPTRYQLLLLR